MSNPLPLSTLMDKTKNMKQSNKYHKILSLFKRDMEGNKKFIIGKWTTDELKFLKDNDWVWTEKVDGTNIRVMWNGKDVIFGGRSDDAQLPTPLLLRLQELFVRFEPRQIFVETFGIEEIDVVLYGEGYGARIQKGGGNYIPNGVDFVLFDVAINGLYLERENVEDIAQKFGIKVVPIIGHGTLDEAIEMTRKGFKSQWGDFLAEGIVARPRIELLSRRRERIITKVKHKDFL